MYDDRDLLVGIRQYDASRVTSTIRINTQEDGSLRDGLQGINFYPATLPDNITETVMAVASRNYFRTYEATHFMIAEFVVTEKADQYGNDVFVSFLYNANNNAAYFATKKMTIFEAMGVGPWSLHDHFDEWSCYMD